MVITVGVKPKTEPSQEVFSMNDLWAGWPFSIIVAYVEFTAVGFWSSSLDLRACPRRMTWKMMPTLKITEMMVKAIMAMPELLLVTPLVLFALPVAAVQLRKAGKRRKEKRLLSFPTNNIPFRAYSFRTATKPIV